MKNRAVTPVGDQQLRHGYTPTALHQLTKLAVNTARGWLAMDYTDLMEAAWFGVVEHLYVCEQWPSRHDLVRAGQHAVNQLVQGELHHYGYYKAKNGGTGGPASSPAFARFWTNPRPDSPERRIVERTALEQILPRLTPGQRDALLALAMHDNYRAAATALGMTDTGFKTQISLARRRFLSLWHEGEEPSKPWGTDRRVESYGKELATHCSNGHEWTPENTRIDTVTSRGKRTTRRRCRACEYDRGVERAQAAREAKATAEQSGTA